MPNSPVPAAGEAMPTMNRRSLLMGLAAASVAAGTATAAAAETSVAIPPENEELLRLGNELPNVAAAFHSARERSRAILAKWSPRWPVAPDQIIRPRSWYTNEIERDIHGTGITRDCEQRPHGIHTTQSLTCRLDRAKKVLKGRSIDKRKIEGLSRPEWEAELAETNTVYSAAELYEADCQRIRDASGYDKAREAYKRATADVARIISSIMAQPAHTMAGIVIKAQALSLSGEGWVLFEDFSAGINWAAEFSTSVLKIAGENGHMPISGRG